MNRTFFTALFATMVVTALIFPFPPSAGAAPKVAPAKEGAPPAAEVDPAVWGGFYPLEYESWGMTREPRAAGQSKFKRGWDTDKVVYDRLSEYPYLALLYNGWGFGIDYNEPRGHWYMLTDQSEVDPSRVKAGGACLTCKTSLSERLREEKGADLYRATYADALRMLPENRRALGVSCPTCHAPDASLALERKALLDPLKAMGKGTPDAEEKRTLVCAQCHVTYILPRDAQMKVTGVLFPWKDGRWGDIPIEGIIRLLKGDPAHLEWTQTVTGFKLGAIRHPEFELFSRGSLHWESGVACADCHMPEREAKGTRITDHDIKSPLKDGMRACAACHDDGAEARKGKVIAIQDRTVAALNRAGYATARAAKLFERANRAKGAGKALDQAAYDAAKDSYLEAYYRVNFMAAENSLGFHNPAEAERILNDASTFADKAESTLRDLLAKAGDPAPEKLDLELPKYLEGRGEKKLTFHPEQEFKTP